MDRARLIEPLVRPPKMDSEPCESERLRLTNVLESSGEVHRLLNYIPDRLQELRWSQRILDECRYWIKQNSASGQPVIAGAPQDQFREPKDIPTSEIVGPLVEIGKAWVPDELCNELVERIMQAIAEKLMD